MNPMSASRTDVSSLGQFETVGVTTDNTFVDRTAVPGQDYVYQVTNVPPNGPTSGFAAVAAASSSQPKTHVALEMARGVVGTNRTCGP